MPHHHLTTNLPTRLPFRPEHLARLQVVLERYAPGRTWTPDELRDMAERLVRFLVNLDEDDDQPDAMDGKDISTH